MTAGEVQPFVLGVDFGGTKVALATAGPRGEILERDRFEIEPTQDAEAVVGRALQAAESLVHVTARATGSRCAAAGIVSPGIVFAEHIELAPNVPGWGELALRSRFAERLELDRVAAGNDANAAGLAELRWGCLHGADPGLYLSLGTGVGAAVLVGGRLLCGAHGAAGEVAYTLVDGESAFADGRAPLEENVGGRFIGIRASRLLGREITAAEAFAATDGPICELVDRALDELAVHVTNMAILLDPERIALGGGMMDSAERILEAIERRLRRSVPFVPALVRAHFVRDAALHGALALALDDVAAATDPIPVGACPGGDTR